VFEVASVKPADPKLAGRSFPISGGPGTSDPGLATFTNVTLKTVLTIAYDVRGYQIAGPAWLDSERYTITAKIPSGATREQYHLMLQNLLAERFHLSLHHDSRQFRGYELVVGKNGPKLKESEVKDSTDSEPPPTGHALFTKDANGFPQLDRRGLVMSIKMGATGPAAYLTGREQPISALADMLIRQLKQPVLDGTDLSGNYDFFLDLGDNRPGSTNFEFDLTIALQDQLGLKLEPRKMSLEMLTIDHADQIPTEN
jgi:uncharacterized protein (TIGR03435 family)